MAERNVPIMMADGKEYMMTKAEAKSFYNGLPRSDEGIMLGGLGAMKYAKDFLKASPKIVKATSNFFGKVAGKNVKNMENIAAKARKAKYDKVAKMQSGNYSGEANTMLYNAAKVAEKTQRAANRGVKIAKTGTDKARQITAGVGATGAVAADMIFNRGGREDSNTTNADGITNAPPVVIDNNGTVIAPNNSPFPFPMTPGSRPDFSDQMGNLQATPYQDAMEFSGDRVNEVRAEGGRVSDAELIANIVSQHSAEQGVGQNVPQRFAPRAAPAMEQLAAAIAAVDKPQAVTNVQKTISSDPGYKDGYKIDNEPKAKPVPQRAATADPLNLFGNKNGYNPFSTKERKAAGKGKLSFKDFFTNNM